MDRQHSIEESPKFDGGGKHIFVYSFMPALVEHWPCRSTSPPGSDPFLSSQMALPDSTFCGIFYVKVNRIFRYADDGFGD